MNALGAVFIYGAALLLVVIALRRGDDSLRKGMMRAAQQSLILLPRMVFALIAAGFLIKLVPTQLVSDYLGAGSGFTGILIGSFAGMLIPSGPVLAFAVAASLAAEGASVPALIAFVTGWSVFASHRVVIFELPMLGASFVRLRLLSVIPLPVLAGSLALVVSAA